MVEEAIKVNILEYWQCKWGTLGFAESVFICWKNQYCWGESRIRTAKGQK